MHKQCTVLVCKLRVSSGLFTYIEYLVEFIKIQKLIILNKFVNNSKYICHDINLSDYQKEGRKEMFYLTTHSTHFILWLHGVGNMVKYHSDNERGNLLLPHGLLFPINSKGSFICTIPQTG